MTGHLLHQLRSTATRRPSARSEPHARFVNTAMVADPARRGFLRPARGWPRRQRRRRPARPRRHGACLEGARSIIGVRSTRRANRRTVSNIVWRYANATVPRQLRDIVVTEYGIADLRGKSDRDVVVEMLGVADSGFQPGLLEAARRAGKLEASFRLPETARNRPEIIEAALAPARRDGLLPAFPLGSEMTDVEQGLAGTLTFLKSAGYGELLATIAGGIRGAAPSAKERAALDRLSLASPATLRDRALRAVVLGGMRRG